MIAGDGWAPQVPPLLQPALAECDECHRQSWAASSMGTVCGKRQRGGRRCPGLFMCATCEAPEVRTVGVQCPACGKVRAVPDVM